MDSGLGVTLFYCKPRFYLRCINQSGEDGEDEEDEAARYTRLFFHQDLFFWDTRLRNFFDDFDGETLLRRVGIVVIVK